MGQVAFDKPVRFPHIPAPEAAPGDGPAHATRSLAMVSSTRQTERRRATRASSAGRSNKRARVKAGTPTFPVHPAGYDPKAADARKAKETK